VAEIRHADRADRDLMPARRRRVTLIELLAAVAILTLPLAFYAPLLRESKRVWAIVFFVVFCAHCVQLEAFLFLVVSPGVRRCFPRARWAATTALADDGQTNNHMARLFLVAGPWLAVLLQIASWADGYRVPGLIEFDTILIFLIVGYVVIIGTAGVYTITELIRRRQTTIRFVAALGLLIFSLPCFLCYEPAYDAGARRIENDTGISRLAKECLAVVESRERLGMSRLVKAGALESPAIRRLRPNDVTVEYLSLRIELRGGFDRYGYELVQDRPNREWVLRRYGRHERVLKRWPLGSEP
jgi:cytochrome c oxidase subunit IV